MHVCLLVPLGGGAEDEPGSLAFSAETNPDMILASYQGHNRFNHPSRL
jgi:hypothetical protein